MKKYQALIAAAVGLILTGLQTAGVEITEGSADQIVTGIVTAGAIIIAAFSKSPRD